MAPVRHDRRRQRENVKKAATKIVEEGAEVLKEEIPEKKKPYYMNDSSDMLGLVEEINGRKDVQLGHKLQKLHQYKQVKEQREAKYMAKKNEKRARLEQAKARLLTVDRKKMEKKMVEHSYSGSRSTYPSSGGPDSAASKSKKRVSFA